MQEEILWGKPRFSLVIATYGRDRLATLERLLQSIGKQTFPLEMIEVIVVDQNTEPILDALIERWQKHFCILHIKNRRKGLSLNRNIGLNYVRGDFVTFPDDDCEYYPDTLWQVKSAFYLSSQYDVILGRLVDKGGKDVFHKWSKRHQKVGRFSLYRKSIGYTAFIRNDALPRFDERFGVGTKYGSNEDADYLYRLLYKGKKFLYTPAVRVFHPHRNIINYPIDKVRSYAYGVGAFFRKHFKYSLSSILLFLSSIIYHTLLIFRFQKPKARIESIKWRIKGFLKYGK